MTFAAWHDGLRPKLAVNFWLPLPSICDSMLDMAVQ